MVHISMRWNWIRRWWRHWSISIWNLIAEVDLRRFVHKESRSTAQIQPYVYCANGGLTRQVRWWSVSYNEIHNWLIAPTLLRRVFFCQYSGNAMWHHIVHRSTNKNWYNEFYWGSFTPSLQKACKTLKFI